MSYHCHFGLEFLDVNAWQTRILKDLVHCLFIFKLSNVPFCHNEDLMIFIFFTNDLASLIFSSFKMFKTIPFVMVFSVFVAL
jgi:hypothetical protein